MPDRPGLFGRRDERAALKSAAADALSGGGGIVLLSGEAGVGSTSLVEAFLGEGGFQVLSAKAHGDAWRPFGLILELLGQARQILGDDELLAIEGGARLSLLLPDLPTAPMECSREELHQAIAEVLRLLCRQSALCVFLDDLHAADEASIEAVRVVTLLLRGEAVLFVAISREDRTARDHPLNRLREDLHREGILREIHLPPLEKDEAELLAREVLGEAPSLPLLEMLLERSHGIPLHLKEIALALSHSGRLRQGPEGLELVTDSGLSLPETLHDAVLLRLDELSPQARALAEAAAVVGQDQPLELVLEVAGASEGAIELFDSGLLVETRPRHVAFRHDLTRQAIQEEIGWSRARKLHRRLAEALTARKAAASLRAPHWLAAGEAEKARRDFLEAARECCRLHAFHDSYTAANQALQLWPDGTEEEERLATLEQLSHCARESGRWKEATRSLREVAQSPLLDDQPLRRAEVFDALAELLSRQGLHDHARVARESSARAFAQAGRGREAVRQRWLIALSLMTDLRAREALEQAETAYRLARELGDSRLLVRTSSTLGQILAMRGQWEKGEALTAEAEAIARNEDDPSLFCEVRRGMAAVREYASEYPTALAIYRQTREECEALELPGRARFCAARQAWILFRMGRWNEATALSEEILAQPDHPEALRGVFEGVLGFVAAHRGEKEKAQGHLGESLRFSRRHQVSLIEVLDSWAFAVLHEAEGDHHRAREHYQHMLALWQKGDDHHDLAPGLCAASAFFARRDDSLQLTRCLDALALMATGDGNLEIEGAVAYGRGESALIRGRPSEAATHFIGAAESFAARRLPLEEARARLGAGRALSAAQQLLAARDELQAARRILLELRAAPLLMEAERGLQSLPILEEGEASA